MLPCDNAFESSCQINCLPEFFKWDVANDTVTCVVQSAEENVVDWTARPVCIGEEHARTGGLCCMCVCTAHSTCCEVLTARDV